MTVGYRGTLPGAEKNYDFRWWNGTDGRFRMVAGTKQVKFNTYSMDHQKQKVTPDVKYGLNYCTVGNEGLNDFTANDQLKLMAKLASSARTTDFHLGKFVAEGKQTVSLAVNTAKTIGRAIWYLKHGRFESAVRQLGITGNHRSELHPKDVAGRFLELKFGWEPLLQDVYEATKAYHNLTSGPRNYNVRVGTFRSQVQDVSASPSNWELKAVVEHAQRLIYLWEEDLSSARTLGLEDPAGIFWEKLPMSFIADWFIPIGTYLDVLNTIPKLKGYWCQTNVRKVRTLGCKPKNLSYYKGCTTQYEWTRVRRTTGSGFKALDIPLPTLKPLDKALSPTHIFEAVALLAGVVPKSMTSYYF